MRKHEEANRWKGSEKREKRGRENNKIKQAKKQTKTAVDLPVNLAFESQRDVFQEKFKKGADIIHGETGSVRQRRVTCQSVMGHLDSMAVGTQVNRDTTSKDTKTSGLGTFCVVMN